MNRYLLKFEKKGALSYISHLDLMRLFKRTFKRAGIELQYSKGFNPHPKMSFAQPLSLGYTSQSEYLEFETTIPQNEAMLVGLLNSSLPYGVTVLGCYSLPDGTKSIASQVGFADYEISFNDDSMLPTENQLEGYLNQDIISVSKPVKKGREIAQIDIRPMISELSLAKNYENSKVIFARIHTGSRSNLNPELLMISLFDYCNLSFSKGLLKIKRLEIYKDNMTPLFSIDI